MPNTPIITRRDRKLSASVFSHSGTDAQGNPQEQISISLQRSYKDKKDEWQRQAINLYDTELLSFALLCEETYRAIRDYAAAKRKEASGNYYPSQALDSSEYDDAAPVDIGNGDSIPF